MTYARLEKSDKTELQLSGGGAVESRRMGAWAGQIHGRHSVSQRQPASIFAKKIEAPWFAYWLHDKGSLPVKESDAVPDGQRYVDVVRFLATARGADEESLFSRRRKTFVRRAEGDGRRRSGQLCERSRRIRCHIVTGRWMQRIRRTIREAGSRGWCRIRGSWIAGLTC